MKIRIIALALTVLMALFAVACATPGDGSQDTDPAGTTPPSSGGDVVDTTTEAGPGLKAVDYEGVDFLVLNLDPTHSTNYPYAEIYAESMDGTTINDAVYERNEVLNAKYNINIVSQLSSNRAEMTTAVTTDVNSGDATYDLIMHTPTYSVTLASQGMLYDYSQLPYVNVEADWWFSEIVDEISIGEKLYYAPNYANICFLSATGLVYFNKEMVTDFAIESPYALVDSGKWTLDKFIELSTAVTSQHTQSEEDTVGFRMHPGSWGFMFPGLNGLLVDKDADDLPILAIEELDMNKLEAIAKLASTPGLGYYSEYDVVKSAFTNGKSLFVVQGAFDLEYYRQLSDFGLVPVPKWEESQAEYISTIHQDWGSFMSVEVSQPEEKLEMISMIMEDMAYESLNIVKPAYYDTVLTGRYAKDAESAAMLDIVYNNVTIDMGILLEYYGVGVDQAMRSAIKTGSTTLSAVIQSQKRLNTNLIKQLVDAFEKYADR